MKRNSDHLRLTPGVSPSAHYDQIVEMKTALRPGGTAKAYLLVSAKPMTSSGSWLPIKTTQEIDVYDPFDSITIDAGTRTAVRWNQAFGIWIPAPGSGGRVCEDDPEQVDATMIGLALSADRSELIEVRHSFRLTTGENGCPSLGISTEATGTVVPNCCESIPSVPSESCSSASGGLHQAAVCHGLARVGGFGGAPRSRTGTYFEIVTMAAYVGGSPVTELNDGDTVEIRADFIVRADYGADDVTGIAALCGTGTPGADVGSLFVDSTVGVAANEVSADIANYVDCFEKGTTYHLRKTYTITFLGGGCPQRSIVWNALVGPGMGAGGGCSVVAAAGHLVFNSPDEYTCPTEVANAVGPNAPCTVGSSGGGSGPSTSSGGGGVSGGFSSLGGGLGP